MPTTNDSAYKRAGVDLAAGSRATDLMKAAVQATYGKEVLAGIGAFGGLFDISALKEMARPVLVASTDGVGTKTRVAARMNQWGTIGQDIVNHCVNDILVQGGRPLFFLDYVASAKLSPEQIAEVVGGAALACNEAGCALLGGETAEMPGVYQPDEIDIVGTIIGVVDHPDIIDGTRIRGGDIILGLPSTGLHTNGFTLARTVLEGIDWHTPLPELSLGTGQSIGDAMLAIHRPYLKPVTELKTAGVEIRGMAHITGGGLIDNPPRIIPKGLGAVLRQGTWPQPSIFHLIQQAGSISDAEMYHVFNMGLGMLVIVPPGDVELARQTLPDELFVVGKIVTGKGGVTII
ncbi:MAG: phosphoribosylformylglycinamidine cyclo-ligase [Candidatus Promineifilaceae bacterium]